jgi:phospholipase/carboxylesterase
MRIGYPDPRTFFDTYELLSSFVDALPEALGVPSSRTVLGGFSQGAVMSYALALGAGRPSPAGLLAMSGFIPKVDGFTLDLESRRGLPAAISHGTLDPVIPVEFGREARDLLDGAGLAVTYRESAMAHTIDPRVVPELQDWLRGVTERAASPATPTTSSAAEGAA